MALTTAATGPSRQLSLPPLSLSLLQLRMNKTASSGRIGRQPSKMALERSKGRKQLWNDVEDDIWSWIRDEVPYWGEVLDAGSGPGSFKFLLSQPYEKLTGVTAAEEMRKDILGGMEKWLADEEEDDKDAKLILGNWGEGHGPLTGRQFDVVLSDYLLGAIDHFSPHKQEDIFDRVMDLIKPGGTLVLCGLQPYDMRSEGKKEKDLAEANNDVSLLDAKEGAKALQLLLDVESIRDASFMLSRQRPYREIPEWWVKQKLDAAGLKVTSRKLFPKVQMTGRLEQQLDWAANLADEVDDDPLSDSLQARIKQLRKKVRKSKAFKDGYPVSYDYTIVARRPFNDEN